ncbi:MAG: aldo/keto reductase [Buchananella hordeovulneris]|nr:aldo/keto reductase [Buchananella hordeovulneris]
MTKYEYVFEAVVHTKVDDAAVSAPSTLTGPAAAAAQYPAVGLPQVELSSGYSMPQFGFGTYKLRGPAAVGIFRDAIRAGHRHFDTAQFYLNHVELGQALREAMEAGEVTREELFVTSKLHNQKHHPRDVAPAFEETMRELGLDYLDLFLIHWPVADRHPLNETWAALEELVDSGRLRSIGVANFEQVHFETILPGARIRPVCNQIELHPYLRNRELERYSVEQGIPVQAWSPLVRGACFEEPAIKSIAARLGATPAQVVLAWHLRQGRVVIPKSSSPQRCRENLGALALAPLLSATDLADIDTLDRGEAGRTGPHPCEECTF